MKGTAPSCCVARDTSGSGSSGSGAKEPKDIDHDHFTHTSPPGADLQSARLDQCEKRDDTGRHLRLAPREGERRKNSLRPVSRGHVRYLGNPRASAILTLRRLEHSKRPGATVNKDLGVWTNQDCALVLIDYQKEIFATIRSETSAA